jgi:hypothetical protein
MCSPPLNTAICNPFLATTMQWLDAWERTAQSGSRAEKSAVFFDPWEVRRKWFVELSEAMDSYLRSPAFMLWMQVYLSAITQAPYYVRLLPSK